MASRKSRRSRSRRNAASSSRKTSRVRWVGYGAGLALVLTIAAVVVGYNAVRRYLRSDEFRVMLSDEAGFLLNGDADFAAFEWDGWGVKTKEFVLEGNGAVQNLNARGIEAQVDIGAAWGGVYRIEDVQFREVELIGDFRTEAEYGEPKIRPDKKKSFWESLLPEEVEITSANIADISGRVLTDDGVWGVQHASVQVAPGTSPKVYEVELTGGEVNTPLTLIPELTIRSMKGRASAGAFYLLSSEFTALERALLRAEGDFDFANQAWQMHGDLANARIEELVAEDWKKSLMGPLELDFKVTGRPGEEAKVTGNLRIHDGMLTALPLLDHIAAYANTARFRRLSLTEASLKFEKIGSRLRLTDIVLASEGLVRLEGMMILRNEVIESSEFRVGITPGTLAHLPGAETKVFERGDLGLLWTPLKVSGTLDAPREDLSERLIAAARERMFELIPEKGQYALKHSGQIVRESTQAILESQGIDLLKGAVIEGANSVLESGGDALKESTDAIKKEVGTLFDLLGRPVRK